MIFRAIFLLLTLPLVTTVTGQTRTLIGKIIDEQYRPVYQTKIFTVDTVLMTTSDEEGKFNVSVPANTKSLIIASIGMEWKSIDLANNCNNLEIVLMPVGTYDFVSAGKVDRFRKKQFDKLPAIHQSAFEKSVFTTGKPCYIDKFIPIKNRLKEIHKNRT
jgi:hypothetical protein